MSPFPVRNQQRPAASPTRLWVESIVVSVVLVGLLAGSVFLLGNTSVFVPPLVFVLAIVLGWRYGFLRGSVAAALPIVGFVIAELVRQALGGTGGSGTITTILIGFFVVMVQVFCVFLAAAIRGRYRPRARPAEQRAPEHLT